MRIIKNATHTAKLIKEKNDLQMYEITDDETQESHGFFVVRCNDLHNQVQSAVPADMPKSGAWFAGGCQPSAISYVSRGRTRQTAQRWFKKLTNPEF